MKYFFKIKNKIFVNAVILAAVFTFLFTSETVERKVNNFSFDLFKSALGEDAPDTNIVLIKISENDISQIGPWPLKRSYYALLINKLTELGAAKIGLEILLSDRFVTLSVYDQLLDNEIERSGKVVLSSVGFGSNKKNKTRIDSLQFSAPFKRNVNIKSGHLNFYENFGIEIPIVLISAEKNEPAFSAVLSNYELNEKQELKTINFISGADKFHQYELLEFFNEANNNKDFYLSIKNKIVIIGVTEPTISQKIKTNFNNELPGLFLHAFAVDNFLQNRFIDKSSVDFSKLLFLILFFVLNIVLNKKEIKRVIFFQIGTFFVLVITSILLLNFNIVFAYSYFILPLAALVISNSIFYYFDKRELLEGKISEAEVLKNLLTAKENQLKQLENELSFQNSIESNNLIEKIKILQNDIKRLSIKEEDNIKLEEEVKGINNFEGIVYCSKSMANVVSTIKKVAPEDATVLILGESGTGKELVARALHNLSKRSNNKFVAVNCSALSENLLESELFGSVKGAFTGAVSDKIGRFEYADKGTIFLDEIAETSDNFQAKLLRVIQNREFEKVGSTQTQKLDVRIIAATNKNLSEAVKEKTFREDLYYRLNVITIELPPLRERKEDIESITLFFINKEEKDFSISKAAMDALINYNWKGNIRELESVIKRAVIFARSAGRKLIQLQDLPEEIASASTMSFDEIVLESLREKQFSHSSIIETAKELEVSRTLISENFRGILFRAFVNFEFDIEKAALKTAGNEKSEIIERVKSKLDKYLINIFTDVNKLNEKEFEKVKEKLNSKYKNLPQKFHFYLDEIIKYSINKEK